MTKDAKPGREARPSLGPSDAVLSAKGPLTLPGAGEQAYLPDRPVISGAPDAVVGAPLTPAPPEARESSLQLGVDSAGGYAVPKQLDGRKPPRRKVTRP